MSAPHGIEGQPHVLVIDESDAVRALLGDAFADAGISSVAAASAHDVDDAVANLSPAERVDLVLCDMAALGAASAACLAQLNARFPGVPVLLMTPFPSGEEEHRSRLAGAVALIPKPLELDDLIGRVTRTRATQR